MNLYRHLIETNLSRIEDHWHRLETRITAERTLRALGYPFIVRSNCAAVMALAELTERRFSSCQPITTTTTGQIDLFALGDMPTTPIDPLAFEHQFQTVANGEQGLLHWGRWGSLYADWTRPAAFGFVSSELVQHPTIASRHCLDTFILIALLRQPVGMLHASGLVKDGHVILLIGPHGAGKSTTALRLIRAGYRLISDTLMFVRLCEERIQLLGYGVGELKLTSEGLTLFPELLQTTPDLSTDGRRKPIFWLRDLMPACVETAAVYPHTIALCLTQRSHDEHTHLSLLDEDIALYQLTRNTSYLDEVDVMSRNLSVIHQLIQRSRAYMLELGRDVDELVQTLVTTARP
jgi:ABC-type cobalamin/Fe3+-siderophores transport system ATPase subunit